MAAILFKRFFEIRLLHEYYLMQKDGTSLFDKTRDTWDGTLADRIVTGSYSILNDLVIEPTQDCKKKLADYQLRFAPKPTGFVVGIEVKDSQLTPKADFKAPVVFQFLLKIKNPDFSLFTNEFAPVKTYYFSNRASQLGRSRKAPGLSNTIGAFSTKKIYKMGELAQKADKLQIARKTTNSGNASDWMPLSDEGGKYTYANTQDACQFSRKKVQYQAPEPLLKITAALFDGNSKKAVKTINYSFDPEKPPVTTVPFDFSEDDAKNSIADGLYLLTISYNDKPEESQMIYFSDTLAADRPYALIEISTKAQDDFKVLTAQNKVIKNHPVFEILFKSRATYWRYRSANRKKVKKPPEGYDFLTEKGLDLITVDPRALSSETASFQRTGNNANTAVFLPTPDVTAIQQADDVFYSDVFIYSDVLVPKS